MKADGSIKLIWRHASHLRRIDMANSLENDLLQVGSGMVSGFILPPPPPHLEGHDLLLWGDLRMLFDIDEKDELWMNQLD
ncbi:hypothetical protein Tco_0335990 [Tanacetum coccineum]